MLQRRLMIAGGIVAPAIVRMSSMMPISILASRTVLPRAAPAIVPASSLMPISPVHPLKKRFIAYVQHVHGGSTTIIGAMPIHAEDNLMVAVQSMMQGTPWWDMLTADSSIEVRFLREGESALSLLT
jgi:hypothetical protein